MAVQRLRLFLDLPITASTEERYSEMFPHMAIGGGSVFNHNPTVGGEHDLLPLISLIGYGDLAQNLQFVEFVDHVFSVILEIHFREDYRDQRTGLVLAQEGLHT